MKKETARESSTPSASVPSLLDKIGSRLGMMTGSGSDTDAVDAIAFLEGQHREVDALFHQFEDEGDRAFRSKEKLVASMIEKLSIHAALEEKFFYPEAQEADDDLVLEAAEEHDNIKIMLRKLKKLSASDETFDAKVTVLKELVQHHVKEEERNLFPKCRAILGEESLLVIGQKLQAGMDKMQQSITRTRETASKKTTGGQRATTKHNVTLSRQTPRKRARA